MGYSWPGNVRELENLVERLLIFCTGHRSKPVTWWPTCSRHAGAMSSSGAASTDQRSPVTPHDDLPGESPLAMDQIERQAIKQALASTNGNVREAAKLLRLGQATVYRKIKRYQIMASDGVSECQ